MALRARNATVVFTMICSFVCLATALAAYTGFVLPRAAGPATVFLLASVAGFVFSVALSRRPRW